ncbi:PEX14 [Candida oxycetoniae]|uniref:Peroxisomal membrane protein PEX14 n=1 Tax=Candida oxycetoniae TaxID=497107 RepID=A0AAI9T034_9ASCO|nr:PEX14 [Candida oxycetoniae]KAI3405894.1 PEX14 [Candida oxycetoniae]
MNEELINSAVAFLQDPNVSASPLTKKVEFLESKGLNQQEIEEALRRAGGGGSGDMSSSGGSTSSSTTLTPSSSNTNLAHHQQLPVDYFNVAPPLPERSWKDYFIMATATAGVAYGLYQVISRYVVPSIIPPSQSAIEEDKETINQEFIKIDKILEEMSKEQEEMKNLNEEKLKDIDTVIENINDFLTKYNKDKLKFDDDLRLMKLEIDNLSNSIEKNMRLSKENVSEELISLNEELQSLKNLIKLRSETTGATGGASVGRSIAPVSSIPSASEILKRAKAKTEANASSSANVANAANAPSSANVANASSTAATTDNQLEKVTTTRSNDVTENNIVAGGIPTWQIKHKENETKRDEQLVRSKSEEKNEYKAQELNDNDQKAVGDVTEEKIKERIKSAGIPPWQLNSKINNNNNSNNSSNSDSNSNNGIPAWQAAAAASSTSS